jgi:hypothetical protein
MTRSRADVDVDERFREAGSTLASAAVEVPDVGVLDRRRRRRGRNRSVVTLFGVAVLAVALLARSAPWSDDTGVAPQHDAGTAVVAGPTTPPAAADLATGWERVVAPFGGGEASDLVVLGDALLAFVPGGPGLDPTTVWRSPDRGLTWTPVGAIEAQYVGSPAATASAVVVVGLDWRGANAVWASADGAEWHRVLGDAVVVSDVARTPGGFVAIGSNAPDGAGRMQLWSSPDGVTWDQLAPTGADGQLPHGTGRIAIGDHGWVFVGLLDQGVWRSPDGAVWTHVADLDEPFTWDLDAADGFVAVGSTGAWHSSDGLRWTELAGAGSDVRAVARGPAGAVAVTGDGAIASVDLAAWIDLPAVAGRGVAVSGATFVVVGIDAWRWTEPAATPVEATVPD